jgi:hypothetical protein
LINTLLADRARGIFQLGAPRDVSYSDAARFLARRLGAAAATSRRLQVFPRRLRIRP